MIGKLLNPSDTAMPNVGDPSASTPASRLGEYADQVRLGYGAAPAGFWGGIPGVVLFGFVLFRTDWPTVFIGWACVTVLLLLVAIVIHWRFAKVRPSSQDIRPWARAQFMCILLIGISFGSAGVLLYDPEPMRICILVVTLFLLAVSGATGVAGVLPTVYALNLPLVLPFSLRALDGPDILSVAAGSASLLMLVVLMSYAHRINGLIVTSIRMRHENRGLNEALTEQRILERTRILEAANRHKSEFMANMSHELRTPLNAIIGFSEVLKEEMFGPLNAKQSEYASDIHDSGHHLLSLINDVLDLSKIEVGRVELLVESFDLRALLEMSLSMVRERAAANGIRLILEIDPAVHSVKADERKLRQVVLNLLSNAVKFTPEQGEIRVVAKPAEGGTSIAVSDTGIGIAAQDLDVIFEAFRQVGTDYTRKREGTGLGLSLAKRLIEAHGGSIRVTSTLGEGTTFELFLPETPCLTHSS